MIDKSEQARLKELYAYNILHTPQEPDFDSITQLVAAICNTPTAFILFIDHNQTWVKSEVGLHQDILPYLNSLIASALLNKTEILVSNDPDLSQQGIRFFAASPLISPNGYVLGMFCILDNETRALSKLQLTTLTTLAAQVMVLLESRRQEHLLKQISHERDLFNKRLVLQSERLEKEREFLRALLENLQEGIVACDENGKLSLFNRTTREIHGMHEQKLPPDQWSEHYDLYLADGKTLMPFERIPLFRAYRGEKIIEEELVISPKNHPARIVKCNGQPILRADGTKLGAVVAMRDITEQKAKEVALAKSEAKLLAIFNQSYIFQGLMNTEGDLIDANDLAFDACGYQREQEIGKKFWETSWWNKDANIAQHIHDMVLRGLKGKISQSGSDYFIASGERRQTELVFSPIRDEHGQITYLLVSGQDVTDRKKNDIELARVNRALRLLSTSVELLIRSNDESKLLNDVCELIVKMGGYELAWAGYSCDDAEKSIRPVAHFGNDDYLQGIQLSWSEDKVTGNGPAGRAVRSRQPIVIKDIRADQSFSPWAASAMAHGYLGAICLPLAHQDKVFGLIAMYTKTPIEIVESEVTLLRELADDLAFGIVNIRIQEESKRFHTALFKMAASVSASIDQEFFLQLTQNMCEATGAGIGMVAKLQTGDETSLQSIATVKDGQPFEALTIPMVSEACQQFIAKDCFILDEPSCLQSLPSLSKFNIVSCVGHRLSDRNGNVIGIIAVMFTSPSEDINFVCSLIKIFAARAEAEMNRQNAELQMREQASLLDKAQDAIIVRGLDRRVHFWNLGAERLYGWTKEEAIGETIENLLYPDTTHFEIAMEKLMKNGEWNGEIEQNTKFAEKLMVESHWTLVYDEQGKAQSVFTINTNITERKAAADKIQNLAFYDPLTKLPNRTLLLDRLKHALNACARNQRYGALLFIDLDNFKSLNDTLGHDIGDLLLVKIGERLKKCVRATDSVARFGGDEFVIMLENISESAADAAFLTKKITEKVLEALNEPLTLDDYEYQSSASIGITLFSDHERNVNELLKHADLAMYQAKAMGRNTLRFFDPMMQLEVTSKVSLETDLRHSLSKHQLSLHYQPQVNQEGVVIGAEALLRWQHPERGMVSPAMFIPIAEETRIILPIGLWVLKTACTKLVEWAANSETAQLSLAINVSVRQFRQADFVEQVFEILAHSGANPRLLKFELTESLFAENLEDVIEKMHKLKARGIAFSLDDFGTGYSSLSYLKRMPLDQLKIDRSFVRDILEDANDATIAFSIIGLAQSLALEVIAEGVETETQRDFLYKSGCSLFQGYYFSKPLTDDAFASYMKSQKIPESKI